MAPPAANQGSAPHTRLQRAGDLAARLGSLQPSDPNFRRGLHAGIAIVLILGLGLAVFGAVGKWPDVDWTFRPAWLAVGVIGMTIFLIANGEIWRRLLHALGPELAPRPAMAIWFTSNLGRYVPAAALLPLLRVAMAEREGVPKRICLASVVYEVALFFVASLLLGAYFVIDLPALQGHWQRFLVMVLPLVGLIALHPRVFHTFADAALERLGRARLPLSLPAGRVLEFVAMFAATFVIAGLAVYALAKLVYPVTGDDLVTFIGAFAVGTALSVLAFFLPGGVVARELGLALALAPVMPTAPAIAIAVLVRIAQISLELALVGLTQLLVRAGTSESETAPPG